MDEPYGVILTSLLQRWGHPQRRHPTRAAGLACLPRGYALLGSSEAKSFWSACPAGDSASITERFAAFAKQAKRSVSDQRNETIE